MERLLDIPVGKHGLSARHMAGIDMKSLHLDLNDGKGESFWGYFQVISNNIMASTLLRTPQTSEYL